MTCNGCSRQVRRLTPACGLCGYGGEAGICARCKKEHAAAAHGVRPKKRGGRGGSEAERLVKAWLELAGWTVHRAAATGLTRLPGGGFFARSHDLFGCIDLLAFKLGALPHETHAIQVTVASSRSARRKKIEALAWPVSWRVSVVVHGTRPKVVGRGNDHFFKIEDYENGAWREPVAIQVDMKAIEAHVKAEAGARRARQETQ
jgi:hypothetical protein